MKAARAYQPDLIVLDIMLPGMDGIELLSHLRRLKNIDMPKNDDGLRFEHIRIDTGGHQVWVEDQLIDLTSTRTWFALAWRVLLLRLSWVMR
ncbi:MAG: hypothetical protein MAG431_01309 [Chloroflexi bacterium]|nr:hypothetical protein [Chloroflexota bacterium]